MSGRWEPQGEAQEWRRKRAAKVRPRVNELRTLLALGAVDVTDSETGTALRELRQAIERISTSPGTSTAALRTRSHD